MLFLQRLYDLKNSSLTMLIELIGTEKNIKMFALADVPTNQKVV